MDIAVRDAVNDC